MLCFIMGLAFAEPSQTIPVQEKTLIADIPAETVEQEPAQEPQSSDEDKGYEKGYENGVEQGKSDAKSITKEVWKAGLKNGALYGAIDGFVFGGTLGFGGLISFPSHIALNNLYVYQPVEITEDLNGDSEFLRGYEKGYTKSIRIHRRASVVTGGAMTLSAVSVALLSLISS
ncbi:MAG: hypothetical protein CMK59_14775 [Proteobacteria bacterium]|nr:hypothetical protein [Pseudomonadota bacterium]